MKNNIFKIVAILSVICLCIGCSKQTDNEILDLSDKNYNFNAAIMSDVFNNIDKYEDKVIKVRGLFNVAKGENTNYYLCMIQDVTQCCSFGWEFILENNQNFPEDYPQIGDDIIVVGQFKKYNEGDKVYGHLINASYMKMNKEQNYEINGIGIKQ